MISALIPVYNFEVKELVDELIAQFEHLSIPFQIILLDDFSELKFKEANRKLNHRPQLVYEELDANIGRSKIRNKLAEMAQYEYLLFLDCDSKIHAKDFVKNYINNLSVDSLVHGGTIVTNQCNTGNCSLRWNYESSEYQYYKKNPDKRYFVGNNFFTSKKLFKSVKFDEEITAYGYEDSVFAIKARQGGFTIKSIMNPVVHAGMECNQVYLTKVESSILNLYKFYMHANLKAELTHELRLLRAVRFLTKTKLIYLAAFLFQTFRHSFRSNLLSQKPKMRYFYFYKVAYFCFLKLQPKKYA